MKIYTDEWYDQEFESLHKKYPKLKKYKLIPNIRSLKEVLYHFGYPPIQEFYKLVEESISDHDKWWSKNFKE